MNDPIHLKSESLIFVGPVLHTAVHPDQLKPLGLIEAPQIAIDGGDRFAFQPVMVVGDGDSQSGTPSAPFHLKPDQNQTDLAFALKLVNPGRWTDLHLFGFLGGRKDHELAAIGEVCRALALRMDLTRATFYDSSAELAFTVHNIGKHSFIHHGVFSVLAFESARFTIAGACQYPVRDQTLLSFSGVGISNVGEGEFTIQSSGVFMMLPSKGTA
jgi:thiamine pyrophosphokinase